MYHIQHSSLVEFLRYAWHFALRNHLCCLILVATSLYQSTMIAQPTYDRDVRMSESMVPQSALAFIDACGLAGKVKWFKEYQGAQISFEAKTRKHEREYSIEFDTLGLLKDAELTVRFTEIPYPAYSVIRHYLDTSFVKYRIVKTQFQWTGEPQALMKLIQHRHSNQPHSTQYEVIVIGRRNSTKQVFDLLFDMHGTLIDIEEIVPRNTDHLNL